ncbi:MAG: hypothetical protein RMK89_02685 [Armatimonadota bacterium]|nr:hypothetical protein [Armatimonadota bacterium]MDW8028494.1 hypothetical protein [Armatimonadota bacterium]MDW8142349.1 hypothetical protein [Armatimonadota bacterium]
MGRYQGDARTARQIIADEKQGRILREFPAEWLDKTFDQIDDAARKGEPKAKTARKLLTSKEYDRRR